VGTWPARLHTLRAERLGLHADTSFDDLVREYLARDAFAITCRTLVVGARLVRTISSLPVKSIVPEVWGSGIRRVTVTAVGRWVGRGGDRCQCCASVVPTALP